MYKFNGFTEKANSAINLAIESAQDLGFTYIGSEHILLGLLKVNDGVAYNALTEAGASADKLEELIKSEIGLGEYITLSPDDFTPRTKRIIQTSIMQASRLGNNYVGTEHILLAILADTDSYAVRFLGEMGVRVVLAQRIFQFAFVVIPQVQSLLQKSLLKLLMKSLRKTQEAEVQN